MQLSTSRRHVLLVDRQERNVACVFHGQLISAEMLPAQFVCLLRSVIGLLNIDVDVIDLFIVLS